jgi:hypothetical protein
MQGMAAQENVEGLDQDLLGGQREFGKSLK